MRYFDRGSIIRQCEEFRKTARTIVPWDKTCAEEADMKIRQRLITPGGQKDETLGSGGICFREIYQKNRQLINIAGIALAVILVARVLK